MSSSPAKVAVPGVSSIVFGSSWEYGCGLGVVEPWSRLCSAFRFFARLVMPESNWVRFGPQSLPALVHLMHFSCTFSSHLRSDGLHYPLSDLRLERTSTPDSKLVAIIGHFHPCLYRPRFILTQQREARLGRPKQGLCLGDPSNRM
jgi:hypothetical protein